MVFSSTTFLYFFLPVVFLLYFVWNNRVWRNCILLIASLLFYSWGEPKFLFLMLVTVLVAYIAGLLIHRYENEGKKRAKKTVFIVACVLLVGNLFVFKYLGFTLDNLSLLFGRNLVFTQLILPIGISFYTFQILSYVIDLYRGKVQLQRNFFYLALYVCFFPQLIAGPIVRYETVESEIRERKETIEDVAVGLRRFVIGLAKKVLLANNISAIAELIYTGDAAVYGSLFYWLAAVAYALQIYFDFSGYSDMAIGLGRIFGFHFLENFNYPYISLSVTEFWRRWHISLSSWFRDYIYIPLGGNRVPKHRWIMNILVVWGLTGFWHGASWNFLMWGFYYAVLLLIEKLFLQKLLDRLPKICRWIYTAFFILIGWVLFDLTDFSSLSSALITMFSFRGSDFVRVISANSEILYGLVYIPLGILCMLPFAKWLAGPLEKLRGSAVGLFLTNGVCILLFLICIVFLLSSTYNPFIYFRF